MSGSRQSGPGDKLGDMRWRWPGALLLRASAANLALQRASGARLTLDEPRLSPVPAWEGLCTHAGPWGATNRRV